MDSEAENRIGPNKLVLYLSRETSPYAYRFSMAKGTMA
jgi:hypothetical protein